MHPTYGQVRKGKFEDMPPNFTQMERFQSAAVVTTTGYSSTLIFV